MSEDECNPQYQLSFHNLQQRWSCWTTRLPHIWFSKRLRQQPASPFYDIDLPSNVIRSTHYLQAFCMGGNQCTGRRWCAAGLPHEHLHGWWVRFRRHARTTQSLPIIHSWIMSSKIIIRYTLMIFCRVYEVDVYLILQVGPVPVRRYADGQPTTTSASLPTMCCRQRPFLRPLSASQVEKRSTINEGRFSQPECLRVVVSSSLKFVLPTSVCELTPRHAPVITVAAAKQ